MDHVSLHMSRNQSFRLMRQKHLGLTQKRIRIEAIGTCTGGCQRLKT